MLSIRRVVVIVYMFVLLRVCGWAGLDHKRTKETLRQTHTQKNLLWSYQVRHDCMPLCEHHSESSFRARVYLDWLDRPCQSSRKREIVFLIRIDLDCSCIILSLARVSDPVVDRSPIECI